MEPPTKKANVNRKKRFKNPCTALDTIIDDNAQKNDKAKFLRFLDHMLENTNM